MYRFLSHPLSPQDPVFPGNMKLSHRYQYCYENGDPFNQMEFSMCNHIGTHIDYPKHFNPKGKTSEQIECSELVFLKPVLLDIPKNNDQMLEREDFESRRKEIGDADLILIRTGFEKYRGDEERFSRHNPAVGSSGAHYLQDELPSVKAIGLDSISAGNCNFIPTAIDAHQILLGYPEAANRYIFIIEDMALDGCPKNLSEVYVCPLRLIGADGMPCTVVAKHA